MAKTSMNIEENMASMLCYIGVWVTGLIFLLVEKENKTVRFHAKQSLFTFLPLSILGFIFGWLSVPRCSWSYQHWGCEPGLVPYWTPWIFWLITLVLWLVLVIKAYQGEKFKLPIVGDMAEK